MGWYLVAMRGLSVSYIKVLTALQVAVAPAVAQTSANAARIHVGFEYVLIDKAPRIARLADMMAETHAQSAKHYAEHAEWGAMQSRPNAPIDFTRLDNFVREMQRAGMTDLVICLRSNSRWASRQHRLIGSSDPTPKPEHVAAYEAWVSAIVERYDADGSNDMPGLRYPVRWIEIGSELSSYEPEPVPAYLEMLEHAYRAAHRASKDVQVLHAAFLTTNAFKDHPRPGQYEAAFGAVDQRIMHHGLDAIRQVLDRGDIFDALNIHSLGDPSEIEDVVAWLRWESGRRGYNKPILISDTATTPYIAWGPATECRGNHKGLGIIVAPATEDDRCRLSGYFTKLVNGDRETVQWTHRFAADDLAKRVIIAAEQGVVLINTAFVEDLGWLKLKLFKAGTGPSAWSGMVDLDKNERREPFVALERTVAWLGAYDSIRRVPDATPTVRLYELRQGADVRWAAWVDPQKAVIPGDDVPRQSVELAVDGAVDVEPVHEGIAGDRVARRLEPKNGRVNVWVGFSPIFLRRAQ